MKNLELKVIENNQIYENTFLLKIELHDTFTSAQPGQFIMIFAGISFEPLLGRPMSIHRIDHNKKNLSILYNVVGKGTKLLSNKIKGDAINILGPLGNAIPFKKKSTNFLLFAGGIGIAPLIWFADKLINLDKNVVMLIGAQNKNSVFPLNEIDQQVEIEVVTDDGSIGSKGLVTEKISDYVEWAHEISLCGPEGMFQSANKIIGQKNLAPAYALFEKEMACGIGICYGCAIKDKNGKPNLICTKGPSFELNKIYG